MPSTEKEQSGNTAYGDHVQVFSHEEHGKLHSTVFGMVSGHQLGFRFRQIERYAVGFCISGHQVNEKGNELGEDVPLGYMPEPCSALRIYDGAQTECPSQNQHAD